MGAHCSWRRIDGAEDQYSVLIKFDTLSSTDSFYKHFNGKRFSSLEVLASSWSSEYTCFSAVVIKCRATMIDWRLMCLQGDVSRVRFVEDVHYTQLIEHAHSLVTSSAEQPTCPVCLGMWRCFQLF
jgi:BRCA1-associated protein